MIRIKSALIICTYKYMKANNVKLDKRHLVKLWRIISWAEKITLEQILAETLDVAFRFLDTFISDFN